MPAASPLAAVTGKTLHAADPPAWLSERRNLVPIALFFARAHTSLDLKKRLRFRRIRIAQDPLTLVNRMTSIGPAF